MLLFGYSKVNVESCLVSVVAVHLCRLPRKLATRVSIKFAVLPNETDTCGKVLDISHHMSCKFAGRMLDLFDEHLYSVQVWDFLRFLLRCIFGSAIFFSTQSWSPRLVYCIIILKLAFYVCRKCDIYWAG